MTDTQTQDLPLRSYAISVGVLGFASGLLLISLEKILGLLVILNFSTTVVMSLALFALAFGCLNPIWPLEASRLVRGRLFVTLVLLAIASQWNRDFTSMSFASAIYYPVPMPKSSLSNELALLGLLLLGSGIHYAFGMALSHVCISDRDRARTYIAQFLLAFAVGAVLVKLFSHWSPYLWFAGGLIVATFGLLRPWPRTIALAVAVACAAFFHLYPQRTFFLWASQLYEHDSGRFGRDVKIDFARIWNDRCIGAVPNNMMATAECRDTTWIPSEYDYVLRSLVDATNPPPPKYDAEDRETNLPWDGWRSGLRILDIGRSGGGNARALELYSGPNVNTAIEFEAAIAEEWRGYWDDYAGGLYSRPESRVLTGSYRANMLRLAEAGESFDYVFYSGIGTKIYIHPRSYVFQEHWLLTEEGTDLTFNRLLKPGGLFWLDWGSSSTQEGKWFIASFPKDVHTLTLWSVQSEFPFAGSPHTYVIASKDGARIEAIRKRVERLTGFRIVDHGDDLGFYRTTDNRPFLQNDMQLLLSVLHLLLSVVWLIPFAVFRWHLAKRYDVRFKDHIHFWLLGLAWGLAEAQFASVDTFVLLPAGLTSWAVQHGSFLLFVAVGFSAALVVPAGAGIAVGAGLLTVFAMGGVIPLALPGTYVSLIGSALSGLAVGAWVALSLKNVNGSALVVALAMLYFGQASVLIFYKVPAFWFGYAGMLIVAISLAAASVIRKTDA